MAAENKERNKAMKTRLLPVFALTIGLTLLLILTLTLAVKGAEIKNSNQEVPSDGFTVHLPAVFKDYTRCSIKPTLISPANGSSVNTLIPVYTWDNGNYPDATRKRIEVAKDSGFTKKVMYMWGGYMTGVEQFRFSTNLIPATTYYWRAFFFCDDIQGPFSEVWAFTAGSGGIILPGPALFAPANGITVPTTTVTFQWLPVPGAVQYNLHWRAVEPVGSSYMTWVDGTQTTIDWLDASTRYEWYVTARNDYAMGTDSETWQFTTPARASSLPNEDLNYAIVGEEFGTGDAFVRQSNK